MTPRAFHVTKEAMKVLRILLILALLSGGYSAAAHAVGGGGLCGVSQTEATDCCDTPAENGNCAGDNCSACFTQAGVIAGTAMPFVPESSAPEGLHASKLPRDISYNNLRPPDSAA